MFAAGAIPTGLAGWWIGNHAGQSLSPAAIMLIIAAVGASLVSAYLAWRWFVAPLRELDS